jgi:amidase
MCDLWKLDATAQAQLVRSRKVSPVELLETAIARIEQLNPRINAVVTPLFERARAQVRHFTAFDAPFAGVPMLVKDASLEIEGTPYYIGLGPLRDINHTSTRTTELARRFERAGFSIAGKTNCPEFSSGITTEPPAFGPVRNPWDLSRTASGSSGGSAAAVAAGVVSVAHGGDATGSLRYPAAACGVVTLKPTRGRMPHVTCAGAPDPLGLWSEFVLARSVRDLAGVLDCTKGATPDNIFSLPPPPRPYTEALRDAPMHQRVGLMLDDPLLPVDPACRLAVEATGRLLEAVGHHVEIAHPAALDTLWAKTAAAIAIPNVVYRYAQIRWLEGVLGQEVSHDMVGIPLVMQEQADAISSTVLAEANATIMRETLAINHWWDNDGWDLLVTPVLRQPAWPLGGKGDVTDSGAWPAPYSFSGQPAMSVPVHHTPDGAEGLPVGVQVVAARNRDDLLLQVAAQLEAAAPWANRWPTIAYMG